MSGRPNHTAEPNPAGRSCPTAYRYRPEDLAQPAAFGADTLYIVGGLYGNPEALRVITNRVEHERRTGRDVRLVFNGDFNWFNANKEDFEHVNRTVLSHTACAGNVEFEIAAPSTEAGCGCSYPDYIGQGLVQRSNAIMQRLQQTAAAYPGLRRALTQLPLHLTVSVAGERTAIVHGDPESLSGWRFAVESMPPLDPALRRRLHCEGTPVTPLDQITGYFVRAGVRVFACTHTCLPFAQIIKWPRGQGLVINNGAAGMPNFHDTHFGVMTRISSDSAVPSGSLYGVQLGGLRCDAMAIEYDHSAWMRRFCESWPLGSPAYQSYFRRIAEGPDYQLPTAIRAGVEKTMRRCP